LPKEIICLENINKKYKIYSHLITALKDINLKIYEGEFLVIQGPNKSGKTTLLNIIAGLEKPDSGKVTVLGKRYSSLNEEQMGLYRAINIGIIFQDYNLISIFNTRENIELPLYLLEFEKERIVRRAQKMLNRLNLNDYADYLPTQLSNGEQCRVAFARALVNNPPVILADEPTANLDAENSEIIVSLLEALKTKEKTIIIVTHNPKITKMADRIIHIYNGELQKDKSASNLKTLFE